MTSLISDSNHSDKLRPNFPILARLTIFLGWIGLHRFYIGSYVIGTLLILLFFTRLTLANMGFDANHPAMIVALCCQLGSFMIQMFDMIKVAYGQRIDRTIDPILLSTQQSLPSKKQLGPLLVWASVLGIFGAHYFYLGKTQLGFLHLITLGGLGIWTLIDIFRITNGSFLDNEGKTVAHIYQKSPHLDVRTQ